MAGDDGISLTNGGFTEGLVKFGSGMRIQTWLIVYIHWLSVKKIT